MTHPLTLEEIQSKLQDRKLTVVADRTGISKVTLANIRDGYSKISTKTFLKIQKYFNTNPLDFSNGV